MIEGATVELCLLPTDATVPTMLIRTMPTVEIAAVGRGVATRIVVSDPIGAPHRRHSGLRSAVASTLDKLAEDRDLSVQARRELSDIAYAARLLYR
jgi:hypothetical protein